MNAIMIIYSIFLQRIKDWKNYLVPKLQLGNAYYQTTISTPSKTTSSPVSK
jgi:hypothetical protein